MAAAEPIPPSLKPIEAFIKRAVEFDPVNPTIGYHCRVYALQQGIEVRDKSDPNAQKYIKALLQQCESQRAVLSPNVAQHHDDVLAFTMGMFQRCVTAYRTGNADRGLAVDFVKTSQLIEVTTYFKPLSEELQLMKKRCKGWAAMIVRDVREGRKPMPPPELVKQREDEDELGAEIDEQVSGGGSASSSHAHAMDASSRNQGANSDADAPRDYPGAAGSHGIPAAPPLEEYGVSPPFVVPTPELSGSWDPSRDGPPAAPTYPLTPDAMASKPPSITDVPHLSTHGPVSGSYVAPPPTVHPPATGNSEPVASSAPKDHQQPVARSSPVVSKPATAQATPVAAPVPKPVVPPTPVAPATAGATSKKIPSYSEVSAAQKKAKFAVSALDFSDIKTAVKELEEALAILKGP
jgi:vacuolar protein sorting-associated protein VTA1